MDQVLAILFLDDQIVPLGSPSRHLVHVLEIFLVVAQITMHVAEIRRRTAARNNLVRIKNQDIPLDGQFSRRVDHHIERQVACRCTFPPGWLREEEPISLQTFAA